MFGVSLPRAIIYAALIFLPTLVISGRYPFRRKHQQNPEETMAAPLKFLVVPPKGTHTATVIFMHVRCDRPGVPPFCPCAESRTGTGRLWLRLETRC